MEDSSQTRYWLALLHAPRLGTRTRVRLLQRFPDPAALFAPGGVKGEGLSEETCRWLRSPDWSLVEADLAWAEAPDRHLLRLDDPAYPPLLRDIADPPPLLFVQGDPAWLQAPQLAMVGSRNATAGGLQTARDFARFLASAGMTITSGLAAGIDAASHQGALTAGGPGATIGVTGTGLDRVYPARHRELAHAIAGNGVLLSEFPPGTAPQARNFPRRNRIISGLSLGTLVVEAALRSGSLITARLALEQGREVFAIPGSIHNPLARGCHGLIRQGAKLVETAEHVLEELGALFGTLSPVSDPIPGESKGTPIGLDADYRKLLDLMGFEPVTVDTLIERSGLTAEVVSSMLLLLDLDGYVSSALGGRYCRTGKS